jgi:hypothetical protein
MKIQLTNPTDSFNLLEVLEFRYIAKAGQVSKKTLTIRVKKYKENGDGSFSYSDDPIIDIFLPDVDAHVLEDVAQGEMTCYNALSSCMTCVAKLHTTKLGIEATII